MSGRFRHDVPADQIQVVLDHVGFTKLLDRTKSPGGDANLDVVLEQALEVLALVQVFQDFDLTLNPKVVQGN